MPEGKFFMLLSKMSGHALGPEGMNDAPGVRLVTCGRQDDNERLYWYFDPATGSLRNKVSGLCIHCGGDGMAVTNMHQADQACQQFVLQGDMVKNSMDGRVLDITGNDPNVGVPICVYQVHGGSNQQWDVQFQAPKYFMLRGEMSGKVLDILGSNRSAGAKVAIYDAGGGDNQLWYEDRLGMIRSKMNDYVFDCSGGEIVMQPYEPSNPNRAWVMRGPAVAQLADPNKVLDVIGECCDNGGALCSYDNHNAGNQKWSMQFV